jgi:hypothetical protein
MRKESKERKESAKRGVFTHNTLFTQLSVCAIDTERMVRDVAG